MPINKKFREYASQGNIVEMQKMLDRKEVDINDVDPISGYSALHFSAENGNYGAVQLLLDYNANTRLKDKDDRTAYDLCFEKQSIDDCDKFLSIAFLIRENTYNPEKHLFKVTNSDHTITFYLLGTNHIAKFEEIKQEFPIEQFLRERSFFFGEITLEKESQEELCEIIGEKLNISDVDFFQSQNIDQSIKNYYIDDLKFITEILQIKNIPSIEKLEPSLIFLLPSIVAGIKDRIPNNEIATFNYAVGIDTQIRKQYADKHQGLETEIDRLLAAETVLKRLTAVQIAELIKNGNDIYDSWAEERNENWINVLLNSDTSSSYSPSSASSSSASSSSSTPVVDKTKQYHKNLNNSLVFVGARHLRGKRGLIDLFKKHDFTVTSTTFEEACSKSLEFDVDEFLKTMQYKLELEKKKSKEEFDLQMKKLQEEDELQKKQMKEEMEKMKKQFGFGK